MSKKVYQYDKKGNRIDEFNNSRHAEQATGVDNSNIIKCCNFKRDEAGGYIWSYQDKLESQIFKK